VLKQLSIAQTANNRQKTDVLLKNYSVYFKQATCKNTTLFIIATEQYGTLNNQDKKELFAEAFAGLDIDLVNIDYSAQQSKYMHELWNKEGVGIFNLIETDNLNSINAESYVPLMQKTTRYHPWFYYLGFGFNNPDLLGNDDESAAEIMVNARIGSFLLKDFLDLSFSTSYSYDFINENNTFDFSLISKIYFPIRKIHLSPFIGGGIGYRLVDWDGQITWSALAGISWYVGIGSFDIAAQYNKDLYMTVGYTFSSLAKGTRTKKKSK
jgi:hypothetical protein